jgi:hypothetical protein
MIIQINKKNYTSEFFHTPEKGVWLSRGEWGKVIVVHVCVLDYYVLCVCVSWWFSWTFFSLSFDSLSRASFVFPFFFVWTAVVNAGEGGGERVFSQCTLEGVARHLLFAMARGRGFGRLVDGGKSLNEKKTSHGELDLWLLLFIIEVRHAICSCFYSMCVCPGLFELLIVTTTTWSVRWG